MFTDPDKDDECCVSSFSTLEDAMLSLPMAFCYHGFKSVVIFGTKQGNARTFNRNRLLHSLSRDEEEPGFDHILLCSPDQSRLDSCFVDGMSNEQG